MPQDLVEIQVEQPQKDTQSLRILMASGLRLTCIYIYVKAGHSVSLKVKDIQVWQPSMAMALVPVAIMISSKK